MREGGETLEELWLRRYGYNAGMGLELIVVDRVHTYDSFMPKRDPNLMTGSQDNRGNVCFNGFGFSGWLVLDVKDVKHGFIGARMEAWGGTGADGATEGWTERRTGKLRQKWTRSQAARGVPRALGSND